jgi:hypothetical protein
LEQADLEMKKVGVFAVDSQELRIPGRNSERAKKQALIFQGLFKVISVRLKLYNIGCLGALG